MIPPSARERMEKQQYRFVGNHSAVKVCGWTKNMLTQKGGCYKFLFYGIRSHQCMQMTTSMFCANRCTFCWRGDKAPVSRDWYGPVDQPSVIINEASEAHKKLLCGYDGNPKVNKQLVEQYKDIKHVALSLTGEPITYPLIDEILSEFHKRKVSTFLVTNAQYPEALEKIQNCTQLYISVDAPNKELIKEVDRPLFPDYYERLLKCLDILKQKQFRTCIRLTIVKGVNDTDLEGYEKLVERAAPDFIEVKGYMHVGASREHLERSNMPMHDEVKTFTEQLLDVFKNYEVVAEHGPSRVVCLRRKGGPKRYIDFHRFFDIVNKGNIAGASDYSSDRMMPN